MSERELEATDIVSEDEIPIIILPDDVDIERDLLSEEPAEHSLPATAPPPAPARPALRKHSGPKQRRKLGQEWQTSNLEEIDVLPSLEALEDQIDAELVLHKDGGLRIFSMPRLCKVVALGTVFLLGLLGYLGWGYYQLPLMLRPLHYLHTLLRPSGTLGLALGVLGLLVMLSSLLYLIRKELVTWQNLGPLPSWMGFHILTGLLGPAIVLFHAAWVPTSALGLLATCSMLVVVASGIVGRYIAVYFPRTLEGRELKFEEIRGRLVVYRKKLTELGVDPEQLRIDEPKNSKKLPWLLPSLARVFYGDWESRREFRRLRDIVSSRGELKIQTELVLFLIKRLCWERQWLVRYVEFRRLVGAWRFMHRWLAIILLAAVFFHVIVAVRYGGLWILGGRS